MSIEQKFLVESMIDDIARYLIEESGVSILEALDIVYNSEVYEKLVDLETGLYYQSPAYCYEYLKHELKYGQIVSHREQNVNPEENEEQMPAVYFWAKDYANRIFFLNFQIQSIYTYTLNVGNSLK